MKLCGRIFVGSLFLMSAAATQATAQLVSIDSLQTYNATNGTAAPYPAVGVTVTVEGTLYVVKGQFNTGANYIMGDDGGIQCFSSTQVLGVAGDRVQVTGPVAVYQGEVELGSVTSFTYISHPGPVVPATRTISSIAHWPGAAPKVFSYEAVGSFVEVTGTIATAPTNNVPTSDKSFNIAANGDTLIIFVSKTTGIDVGAVAVGDHYRVRGALVKYNKLLEMKPRTQFDLVEDPLPRTIRVRPDGTGDAPTIQAAIDAAAAGDTISLADGIYRGNGNRDLDPNGKSLTIRSLSGLPANCVIDCEGSAAAPHNGFYFHNSESMKVHGLTVRGGYGAAGIQCGDQVDWQHGAGVTLEHCICSGSAMGHGMSVGLNSAAVVRYSVFTGNNGSGFTDYMTNGVVLDHCTFSDNAGSGVSSYTFYSCSIANCSFLGNGGDGLSVDADGATVAISNSIMSGNAGNGLRAVTTMSGRYILTSCIIVDNMACGIAGGAEPTFLSLDNCDISRNALMGITLSYADGHFTNSSIVGNVRGGILLSNLYHGIFDLISCRVSDNGGVGLRVHASAFWLAPGYAMSVTMAATLICDNDSAGVQLGTGTQLADARLTGCTIARNAMEGLAATGLDSLILDRSLLIGNSSALGSVQNTAHIVVGCTNIFGNNTGDWTGSLAPWRTIPGNIAADPLFCDPTTSDYTLSSFSPCVAPASGACGQMGATGVGCTTPAAWQVLAGDVPSDQGGKLRFRWVHHPNDALDAAPLITYYELQRQDATWTVQQLVMAAKSDSYAVTVDTPDTFTVGSPAPSRNYRVIARTVDPLTNFVYLGTAAYSIDNLAPSAPQLSLYDGETNRALVWQNPAVSDFKESCLYRGGSPDFVPEAPMLCSASQNWYQETDLRRYWYKVRASDTHGNIGEWSAELVGQYPTGVPTSLPMELRLLQNEPNPFNPATTLRFELPTPGQVRLSVYDIAGRLVQRLVDGQMPAGAHEATWKGRDAAGRSAASGVYFARLEHTGQVRTIRMSLVQ